MRSMLRALKPWIGFPSFRARPVEKNPTRSAMSDLRSRSGGTSIGNTFKRYRRSGRNFPSRAVSQLESAWREVFEKGRASFVDRFWNEESGNLADVVDADHVRGARDDTFRPNQILAVGGLPFALIDGERARRIVDVVEQRLLTPLGLRSLAPGEPGYAARYEGDASARDSVYHQGTAWPWLMGPFVEAWVRVRGGSDAARGEARRRFLDPMLAHLRVGGLGHVSEIANADDPFAPKGCPFQAWSLGELLRLDRVVLAEPKRAPGVRRAEQQWA